MDSPYNAERGEAEWPYRPRIQAHEHGAPGSARLISARDSRLTQLLGPVIAGFGRIVFIGSGYSKRSGGALAYTTAKHGLIGMTRALAGETAKQGDITVNCLCQAGQTQS